MSTNTLFTIDDLAARWQTTAERVHRRIRDVPMPSINVGTTKNPDLRFRLASVESWECEAERPSGEFLGGEPDDVPGRELPAARPKYKTGRFVNDPWADL